MARNSVFLDVDPSILEKNMKMTKESDMEKELNNLFESENTPHSILVKPSPGFCVKTYSKPNKKKIFINICLLEDIPCPPDISSDELMHILDSEQPSSYRVPMSIGVGRTEYDKSGTPATAYDVAINPKFFKKVSDENLFQKFFLTIVFEGLQDKYHCEIDMENYVILQNRKSLGTLQSHRIELRNTKKTEDLVKSPFIEEISPNDPILKTKKPMNETNISKNVEKIPFRLRKGFLPDDKESVIAEFKIPNNVRVPDLRLEVGEDRVLLQSGDSMVDFFLPYSVDQDRVVAQLDRNTEILSVKMPMVH